MHIDVIEVLNTMKVQVRRKIVNCHDALWSFIKDFFCIIARTVLLPPFTPANKT